MFERFSQEAREVVVRAQEIARTRGQGRIDSRHLLHGLMQVPELRTVFERFALTQADLLAAMGELPEPMHGHLAFSKNAKHCLEGALREAVRAGGRRIAAAHVMLGILSVDCGAHRFLEEAGVDLDALQLEVREVAVRPESPGSSVQDRLTYAQAAMAKVRRARNLEPSADAPTCPTCRANLTENLRCRKIEAAGDDGSVWVWLFFCCVCGRTINAGGGDQGSVPAHG